MVDIFNQQINCIIFITSNENPFQTQIVTLPIQYTLHILHIIMYTYNIYL